MKFEEQEIIVKLGKEEDGDQAVLKFLEPLENERLQIIDLGRDNLRKALQIVYKNCVSVENLFAGDREVTTEQVQKGDLRGSIADAIAVGYYAALNPLPEDPEKNA